MIHELIDPKKKTNRSGASQKNTKPFQEGKAISEEINIEASDSENKESTSTIFIPPWLRNSLGLNQRNNLRHTANTDVKSSKLVQKGKETKENESEPLKTKNVEQDCCKKATERFEIVQEGPQEVNNTQGSGDVEAPDNRNETISLYWDVKRKKSETEWSTNAELKPLKKEDSKMTSTDVMTSADNEKLKEEEKKRLKLMKQKHKLRKRIIGEGKQSDRDKHEMDFLLEMKAREALDNYMKGDVHNVSSEMRQLEAKLLLLRAKSHDMSNPKLNQQEGNKQNESDDQLERVFEHMKEVNLRMIRNSDKKREEKEENDRELGQKCNDDGKSRLDRDSLLSTDDENDIKRFSEFLSKNKNQEEKRKCLEEVRNYFEKKRRTRLTKRRFMEEGRMKAYSEADRKEEYSKEKTKSKDYRGRRSKFALCDEEVVEKAVDEALQKFVELYHFRVSPRVMGNMKKNILQAIATDSMEIKLEDSIAGKKINLELLSMNNKEGERLEASFIEAENAEVAAKERPVQKESKKAGKNENASEQVSKYMSYPDIMESEKLKRLKKEFDMFLHSVQTHFDVTNLKLQSIILEKEEQTATNQNVQFVYNFRKKALEQEKPADCWHSLKGEVEYKNRREIETQTTTDMEPLKRNVKVQVLELKTSCEQGLQTEAKICITQNTQTDGEGTMVREIKELKNYDVNPGLYRMVKSKEAGKFYLYPEQLEGIKQESCANSNSSLVKIKSSSKRNLVNVLSSERTRERQVYFREREKGKQKKSKRTPVYAIAQVKKRKKGEPRDNSLNCLYFRNADQNGSDSISSKKDMDLMDENLSGKLETEEDLRVRASKEEHLGCFWFWNGEKISPGCDLKTHVENLLKEKLTQITNFGGHQNEPVSKSVNSAKNENEIATMGNMSEKNIGVRNANALFCFDNTKNPPKESALMFTGNETSEERKKNLMAEKKEQPEEVQETRMSVSQDKSMRSVATQNCRMKYLSLNLAKNKSQSRTMTSARKKCPKRNIVLRPAHGRIVNIRKAEDILRAVEEIKKMKFEIENSKKVDNSSDSESLLDCSTSTSDSKNGVEEPLSVVLGIKDRPEVEEISNSDIKRLKRLISLVDREVQTNDLYIAEDANSIESQTAELGGESQKHLNLIGQVLSRANQKERECLWNDVRDFIKTKIGKDINDDGTREVCIEIEQDVPKIEQGPPRRYVWPLTKPTIEPRIKLSTGKMKHSVMTKGQYVKNDGDVEVEIDLTLDDLARLLRQRQKKIRRRNLYRSSRSKNFLSSSSGQSDITRDDLRRYQKYLHRFATLGEFPQEKDTKAFRKNKGN